MRGNEPLDDRSFAPPSWRRNATRLTPYAAALGAIALATALRLTLDPMLGPTRFPFATLFFAVLLVAWRGGFGPAVLATVAGAVAAFVFLLAPRGSLSLAEPESVGGLVIYLAVGLGIAAIGGGMRRARQRAEAEAREAEARREDLQVTLHSIGDAVITTDARGCVTSLNAVAVELTGWEPRAAVGQPLDAVFRIVDEATREPAPNPVAAALLEGRVVGLANHTVLIARDGCERPIDDSAAPIRDASGTVRGAVLVFRDITERRHAERRIRRSEEELRDLFENANVGLHWLAQDGTILRANRAELEMLGYTHEEYVGHPIAEFHADATAIAEIEKRLAAGETLEAFPARMRCRDGTIKDVLINSTVHREDGRLAYSRSFTLDVSDRARAAEAQAWLAAVVEFSDDAIVSKTLDGIITSWNTGAERLFGYSAEEAVGKPIAMIIPPDRLDEERRLLERLRQGERIDPFDTVRVTKSGQLVEISLRISPVRDRHGRIVGASKLARDVGAMRRAERALRESDARFRTLADNIAQFAWMADRSGSILWYNRRWFDYTGTTLEQMLGWGWKGVVHPDHVERVAERYTRCVQAGEVWEDTFPLRGADGSYRWFLSRALPIRDEQGHVLRWFGTNTDITAQREAEQVLKDADRNKNEFLATLAHELRNPLAPIRNSLEILAQAHGNGELLTRAHAILARQVAHLERLVDDLLDVARISGGRLALRRDQVQLAQVVAGAVEMCQPMAQAAGLELTVDVAADPMPLHGDTIRLVQVFSNLLSNACKFTPRGGRVRLAARREGGVAVVVVRDTGRGIPTEMLSRVFDMFTQLDTPEQQAPSGLGIGLNLVRRLIELHGGSVEAFSAGSGHGCEFTVRLPLELDGDPVAPPTSRSERPAPQRRILVVDDNVDAAESLAQLLQLSGHDVALAHDGETALRMAESLRPEVVLLDIGLPKVGGHDVCRWIREQNWGAKITLVALTGWGQEDDRRLTREAGFDHHLVKPVDVRTLRALLASAPDGSAQAGEPAV